jgi:hypothetical protein
MTQIELFGCTCAGKSTSAGRILQACQERGIDLLTGDDFVLEQIRLNWIQSQIVRTLLTDLFSLSACVASWGTNLQFYVFAIRVILRLPIGRLEKLNLARNVLKRIGVYEIISRSSSNRRVVLVDGGTLQAAHHLFVHVSAHTDPRESLTFVRLVPLPDAAVYVTQSESTLVERAIKRGHRRIPDRSQVNVGSFVKRAVDTFDIVAQQLVLEEKLLVLDGQRNVFVAQNHQDDPLLNAALEIVRSEMDAVNAGASTSDHA